MIKIGKRLSVLLLVVLLFFTQTVPPFATEGATVSAGTTPTIKTQPKNITCADGATAKFKVAASGTGLTYRWYFSDDNGSTWTTTPITAATYTANATDALHGRLYRCTVSDANGKKVVSNSARLLITDLLTIKEQPKDVITALKATAKFQVVATGKGLTYQWQYSNDNGKTWKNSSVTKATYSTTVTTAHQGRLFRCIIKNSAGTSVTSATARLLVKDRITIQKQPADVTADSGEMATFSVSATGNDLRYQWQYSDDGETWENTDTAASTYQAMVDNTYHGRALRCVITDAAGNTLTSDTATIRVAGMVKITAQPQDVRCETGETATFRVTADGAGLKYLWQYSTDGTTWNSLDIADAVCTLTADRDTFARSYRCKVWDDDGNVGYTDPASLIDKAKLILAQPQDWVGCVSGTAYFEVKAADSVTSCRWQISSNGGESWTTSSITDTYYTTAATATKNGWLYRCIVTDGDGRQQTSNPVTLNLSDSFHIAKQPTSVSGELGQDVSFTIQAGGTANTFTWQKSADGETWKTISKNATRITQTVTPTSIGNYYRCVVTGGDGQQLVSESAQLKWNRTGFFTHNGYHYYAKDNGRLAAGLETINGNLYYFSEANNRKKVGLQKIDGKTYYFTDDGPAAKGFLYLPAKSCTYYFGSNHAAATGWTKISGKTYYFYTSGAMAFGLTQIGSKEYFFDHETGAQTYGLVKVGLNDYMYFQEGKDQPYTGLRKINGALYYFSAGKDNYGMALGSMQTVNGKTYYFDPQTKKAKTGFIEYNGNTYYLGSDSVMVKDKLLKIGKKTYLFNTGGAMQYGLVTRSGKRYYFDPATGAAVSGWVELDGIKFYFDSTTYAAKTGLTTIGSRKYYFKSNGYLDTGIITVSGVRYYFAPKGKAKSGFVEINKKKYYIKSDQTVATGLTKVSGKLYYFDSIGVMRTGFRTIGNKRYYFDPESGAAVTGLVKLTNGNTYYFKGASGTGTGLTKIDGGLYYLNKNGVVQYGRIEIGGHIYYFDPVTGRAVSGWCYIRSNNVVRKAYFDPKTFRAVKGLKKINGAQYYFSSYGWAMTGKQTVNGKKYYFSQATNKAYSGTRPTRSEVWVTKNGAKYYYDAAGKAVTGLQVIDGALYYFDKNGKMKTGVRTVNGKTYYFTKSGAKYGSVKVSGSEYHFSPSNLAALTGLQKINGKYYYYLDSGKRKSGWTTTAAGERLYVKSSGLQTGLATISGKTYYFGDDGIMRTGVQLVTTANDKRITCLFNSSGVMVTGMVSSGGSKYYYNKTTGARVTGLVTLSGSEYYFEPSSGKAATGLRNIDGIYCYFDAKTAKRKYGLQKVDGRIYYFTNKASESGLARGMKTVDGKKYYFKESSGVAISGYYVHNDVKYYFDPATGASVARIHRRPNGDVYSVKAGGGMNTGWVKISGKTYYFYPTTGLMAEGLASAGNKLYYFDYESGMLRNTSVVVGGITYKLDKNGYASATGDTDIAKLINAGIGHFDKGYGNEGDSETPTAFTCSQFVKTVFGAVGVDIINNVDRQYYSLVNEDYDCEIVADINQAKAGDLIYYSIANCKYGSSCNFFNEIHHVGIYLGDGKIMESNAISGDTYNNGPMLRDLYESTNVFIYKLVRIRGIDA